MGILRDAIIVFRLGEFTNHEDALALRGIFVLFSIEMNSNGGAPQMARIRNSIQKDIQRMANRIAREFRPDQIILFGSHARGEAKPESDVDMLVVMPVKGSKRAKAVEIGVALQDFVIPKDIVVTTPEEFQWRKEVIGTIERPASLEGKLLYVRK